MDPRVLTPSFAELVTAEPGPFVGDDDRAASAAARLDVDVEACPFCGMGEDVLQQGVDRDRDVGGSTSNNHVSSGQVRLGPAALVLGEHAPESEPFAHDSDEICAGVELLAQRPAGRLDDVVDGALECRDVLGKPRRIDGAGTCVGVEAQRRDRRAQPVRKVGDDFAFGGNQLTDAPRQPVEGDRQA